jgi:8-oxo-dGTP pyrophosphatase MutT (NUDIX family)
MKTHKEYLKEKEEYSYKLFKKHRLFKIVRAVIIDENNQVVLIKYPDGGVGIPGGGVDDGETLREAIVRESMEETGLKVFPIKILSKSFYTTPMEFEGNKFVSKRVVYYYLCKKIKNVNSSSHLGLEGEFDNEIEISSFDIEVLRKTKLGRKGLEKLRKAINLKELENIKNGTN